jgi:AhpD family alkylhydroperoxidase
MQRAVKQRGTGGGARVSPSRAPQTDAQRREAIVQRGEDRRGFVPYWLRMMGDIDVDFLEAYERIYELTAVREGALPAKFRELIVVAAVAIGGYGPGLKEHVRRALRLGATKEEIVEVFQSAYFHTGALTLVHGMIALIDVLKEDEQAAAGKSSARARKPRAARAARG